MSAEASSARDLSAVEPGHLAVRLVRAEPVVDLVEPGERRVDQGGPRSAGGRRDVDRDRRTHHHLDAVRLGHPGRYAFAELSTAASADLYASEV